MKNLKDNTLAVAAFAGLVVCLWRVSVVIGDMQTFNDWNKPVEIKNLIQAGLAGILAFGAAAGLNVRTLIGQFVGGADPAMNTAPPPPALSPAPQPGEVQKT